MISEFMKEKVFWTRKMNLKLVEFIESKPNVWNPKHPKYTSIAYRDRTYAEFASKYGNEFTGQAVKERWTNIRSTFANYLRKLKASRTRGNGEVYKINWHLWEPCKFLLKVNKKTNKTKINNIDDAKNNESTKDETNISSDEAALSEESTTEVETTCQNIANGLLNIFKGIQNDVFGIENSKYAHVGQRVTERLSQLDSYEAAQMCRKITDILTVYQSSCPVNPNNVKSENF